MMMRTDRRLIHPGDQGRAKSRANRRGRVGTAEDDPFTGQSIHVWSCDQFLPLIAEVRGHVIDQNPNDIGSGVGTGKAADDQKQESGEKTAGGTQDEWHTLKLNENACDVTPVIWPGWWVSCVTGRVLTRGRAGMVLGQD